MWGAGCVAGGRVWAGCGAGGAGCGDGGAGLLGVEDPDSEVTDVTELFILLETRILLLNTIYVKIYS